MYQVEFALVLIKPDAIEQGLESEIFNGLRTRGLGVERIGTIKFDQQLVLDFYEWGKLDYPEAIMGYICVTPLPIWIVTGEGVITKTMALKNCLRKKYSHGPLKNLFHCPCSFEESKRQFNLIRERSVPMNPSQRTPNQVEVIIFKKLQTGEPSYLMLKRVPKRGGFWQPVTGNVEVGETFEAAALREIQEELGISDIVKLVDTNYSYEFTDNDIDQFERIFGAEVSQNQEIKLSSEHSEYRWASREECLNVYLKYPGNKEGLRHLHLMVTGVVEGGVS